MNDGEPVIAPFGSILVGALHGPGGLCCVGVAPIAGPRGRPRETSDFLSHGKGRRALHFLSGGWAKRCADAPFAARISFVIANVRAALRAAFRSHSDWPDPKAFNYTFDHIASVMDDFVQSMGLSHYTLYMQDYGGPVGFRMALAHPERVDALIVQDAVAHNEGLGELWKPRRAFWADRAAHESAFRANFLSLATTRARHAGDDPNPEPYDPDLWTDELAFLSQPGQADIQTELFYDYRTNVDAYPKWQAWMREIQPHLLVIWGKHDLSFDLGEPERYRKDVRDAQIHVLDASHFALDTKADEIAALVRDFMEAQKR
jgi:pimeloyl-ACP methyl ester carboxylesterase